MDLTTALTAIGGLGIVTTLQQTIGWFLEERRKGDAAARAEATAPATQQSLVLTVADQATTLQQRSIKALEDRVEQQDLELGTLRAENGELRDQMAIKDREVDRLYTRIGKLEDKIRSMQPEP